MAYQCSMVQPFCTHGILNQQCWDSNPWKSFVSWPQSVALAGSCPCHSLWSSYLWMDYEGNFFRRISTTLLQFVKLLICYQHVFAKPMFIMCQLSHNIRMPYRFSYVPNNILTVFIILVVCVIDREALYPEEESSIFCIWPPKLCEE